MIDNFKPMNAQNCTLDDIKQLLAKNKVLYLSKKLDGIRCIANKDRCLSKSMKNIANKHIYKTLTENIEQNTILFDGEIVVPNKTFQEIQSAVMSIDGEPDFEYHIFDVGVFTPDMVNLDFLTRQRILKYCGINTKPFVRIVEQVRVDNIYDVIEFEKKMKRDGEEGYIIRTEDGKYKYGRSTIKEGYLLKVKFKATAEAVITGFEEQMENTNKQEVSETGHSKRSSAKSGMVPKNTLGSFIVKGLNGQFEGIEFKIAGTTKEMRQQVWDNKGSYIGKIIEYEYQDCGIKTKPRQPVFLRYRNIDTM